MKDAIQPTERDVRTAVTLTDMADELGITPQGMIYRVKTPMFQAHVRPIETRAGRRTWYRADFRRYKKLCQRIAATTSGK